MYLHDSCTKLHDSWGLLQHTAVHGRPGLEIDGAAGEHHAHPVLSDRGRRSVSPAHGEHAPVVCIANEHDRRAGAGLRIGPPREGAALLGRPLRPAMRVSDEALRIFPPLPDWSGLPLVIRDRADHHLTEIPQIFLHFSPTCPCTDGGGITMFAYTDWGALYHTQTRTTIDEKWRISVEKLG